MELNKIEGGKMADLLPVPEQTRVCNYAVANLHIFLAGGLIVMQMSERPASPLCACVTTPPSTSHYICK